MKNPDVVFPSRRTKRGLGLCNHRTGRIQLFAPKGQTVGVLLHELAHLQDLGWNEFEQSRNRLRDGLRDFGKFGGRLARPRLVSHGRMFHLGHTLIHKAWEQIKHKYMPFEKEAWSQENTEGLKDGFDLRKLPEVKLTLEPNWFDMGYSAFKKGQKRVPANDSTLMVSFHETLHETRKRIPDFNLKNALTLWLNGWDKANLETPVETSPAPNVERRHRLTEADLELLRQRGRVVNGFVTRREQYA